MEIYDINCPKCNNKNWVNNGDINDLSRPDVESVKCWSCKHVFFIDENVAEFICSDDPEDGYMIDGTASPNETL